MSSSKERQRTRGEIACAECRRLKARCDRQVPCSTCVKRGCSMLCPNGKNSFMTSNIQIFHTNNA
ncbi:hypothetical protein DFJ58DRAFT_778147 [Suillus subalutaceus]|uniref:uncharacterized protein n=1 Tax=Suillus subalutaceus TaxID=48586 RepID=UPI001B8797C7|nr:uncharacterized protein DFJ58DRAFT_778147 [Suillus subalutaceus]KAG1861204.1 hypothetical protein DFJ58DRAFT_778147 [Suillus subalutaceus]